MMLEQGVINYLDEPQLQKWREVAAAIDALNANPEAYSRGESVRAYFDLYVFLGGLYHEFQITERKRDIWVSTYTGAITFMDEDEEDDE